MLFSLLLASQSLAGPAPVRGWMIHGASPVYQHLVLQKAKEYGINHLEISGDNPTFSEEMVGAKAELVEATAKKARTLGIDPYIWIREFNTRAVNLSLDPSSAEGTKFWQARKHALRMALDAAPSLSGIVLSYASTPTEIWQVKDPSPFWQSKSMEERIRFVTGQFLEVANEKNKRVYIRDFNHSPQQLHWLVDALKDGTGYTMHSKWDPQDWQPFYPDSFAIGAYGKTPQVIEADLGAEYWGRSMVPVSLVRFIKKRWDYDRAHGCRGVVARVDRDDETALNTPSELNLYALSRYLSSPDATPDQIYNEWNLRRYRLPAGSMASKTLTRIYERTFEQAKRMYFTLGFWTPKDQTMIPKLVQSIEGCIIGKSNALWDPSAKPTEMRLRHPDAKTVEEILHDRDEAIRLADLNVREFKKIEKFLQPADRADWRTRLDLTVTFAHVWRSMAEAVWCLRRAEEAKDAKAAAKVCELAEAFASKAHTLRGTGPGSALRTDMADSALKLSADIVKRAKVIG